jgi:transcriptional regulator with XRE-family HTH domain
MNDLKNIGCQQTWNEFKANRIDKGISQTDLGNKVGLSQGRISHYEAGEAGKKRTHKNIEQVINMCHETDFPVGKFIPHIRTKDSQTAACKTFYLNTAWNALTSVTGYGITNKDPTQRLKEQDKKNIWEHKLVNEWTFKSAHVAATLEYSVKQRFDYNPRVGEYTAEEPKVVKQYVEMLIELGGWEFKN